MDVHHCNLEDLEVTQQKEPTNLINIVESVKVNGMGYSYHPVYFLHRQDLLRKRINTLRYFTFVVPRDLFVCKSRGRSKMNGGHSFYFLHKRIRTCNYNYFSRESFLRLNFTINQDISSIHPFRFALLYAAFAFSENSFRD